MPKFMQKLLFVSLLVLFLSTINFSQTATKIDEMGYFMCGDNYRIDLIYRNEIENKPQNKIYIIYYEGQREFLDGKYRTQRGDALNRAKELPLFLKMVYKVPDNKFILINGGFRERLWMEIWSVPKGAEIPKATPTLQRKDVKFAKGKPQRTRKMACCYESC